MQRDIFIPANTQDHSHQKVRHQWEAEIMDLFRGVHRKVSVWATSKMLGKDPNLQITSIRLIRRFLVEAMLQSNTYLLQIGNLLQFVFLRLN